MIKNQISNCPKHVKSCLLFRCESSPRVGVEANRFFFFLEWMYASISSGLVTIRCYGPYGLNRNLRLGLYVGCQDGRDLSFPWKRIFETISPSIA